MAYQKPNGVWYSDFIAPDLQKPGTRRRYRLALGSKNRRDAEAEERKMMSEIEQQARTATPVQPNAVPVPESAAQLPAAAFSGFARFWMDTYARVHMRPSTVQRHEKTIRVWLVPFFQDRPLTSITRLEVQQFIAHCATTPGKQTGKKLSPKTINEHLSCLSTLLSQAVTWGYLRSNPCTGTDRLELAPEEWDFYTAEEAELWLIACHQHEPAWYPFFLTGFRTGLRLGELFALEWGDLDLRNRQLHVRRAISAGEITLPKSRKRRIVDVSPHVLETLHNSRHLKGELIFSNKDGQRLNRDQIKHPWTRITRLAGLRTIRLHDMRHSFASQLVMKGVPLLAVQQLLGHASLSMTMRYAHLAPGASQQFVALLDDPRSVVSAETIARPLRHSIVTAAAPVLQNGRGKL